MDRAGRGGLDRLRRQRQAWGAQVAGRVRRLFQRYALRHLELTAPGPVLRDGAGRAIGRVERIVLTGDHLRIEGHASADLVILHLGGRERRAVPKARAGGTPAFRLVLPFAPGQPELELRAGDWTGRAALPGFGALRRQAAALALWPGFATRGAQALPAALRWLRHHDMAAREQIKRKMGLNSLADDLELDPALLAAPQAEPPPALRGRVQIVMPVYQAFDDLTEALDRLRRHSDLPWHLILVEDASPDPRIRPWLADWVARVEAAGDGQASLIANPVNLGFIGAVNLGLARARQQAPDSPVVLLNSDAFVPEGWLSRLVAPILADPLAASVTPMSNDAELASVPAICTRTVLEPGEADAIDAVARSLAPGGGQGAGLAEAPTGVGFCMALSPRFLARLPGFDTAFGRGYGEEVDWCQKAVALGGRHLYLPGLFVEHRGGASFGSAAKAELLRRNGAEISRRYPQFDTEVQGFLGTDPLVTGRLALGLAWAAARAGRARVPVHLAHSMKGGAEMDLVRRLKAEVAARGAAVVLRVGGTFRWQVELHSAAGVTRAGTNDADLVLRLLSLLPRRRVIYGCGVGDPDPVEIPGLLLALGAGQQIVVQVHDYLPVSPSYALVGEGGLWRGLPRPGTTDRAHMQRRPDGRLVDLAEWQAEWGALIAAAARIEIFSEASGEIIAGIWPEARDRLVLRPHRMLADVPRLAPPPAGARPVIGVLGNIGPHKGAAVLADLSRRLARDGEADLVLIGNLDPAYRLARPARIHGSYRLAEIPALAARYGITCWLMPAVWPETFSFATHEVLATGLPVYCFDLGAQGEAVRRAVAAGAPGAAIPLPAERGAAVTAILDHVLHRRRTRPVQR